MPSATWNNLPTAKQTRLLRAAAVEFGRRGYEAGSLNVIARDAGVSKGSLFQYFDDKLDLWRETVDATADHVRAAVTETVTDVDRAADTRPTESDMWDELRRLVERWLYFFEHHPVERAASMALAREFHPGARRAGRAIVNRHWAAILDPMIKRGRDLGDVRGDTDPALVRSQIVLMLRHLAFAPYLPEEDPALDLAEIDRSQLVAAARHLVDALERAWGGRVDDTPHRRTP